MTKQRNMNNGAYEIAQTKFKDMLRNGAFPKIEYESGNGFEKYSMIEYATTWARFTKVVHEALKLKGFEYGLWQNARNQTYLGAVTEIVNSITEQQINENMEERFQTMFG